MHHPTWGKCADQAPGCLSCLDVGRAQNTRPIESGLLWSTREPEPELLRPGKYMQPRAYFSIMNNAITEIKNTLEETNSRITEVEDSISEVEDRMVEINEAERRKRKKN